MIQRGCALLVACLILVPVSAQAVCARDALDREVCLEQAARSVVSLSPGATELLFSAGAGDRVVAVSAWSDYPTEAANLPQVGDSNRLDLEAIVALAPDLVVAWVDGNSRNQLERLADLGITVFWLAPRTFNDIAVAVENLALLTGNGVTGRRRADAFRADIAELQARYDGASPVRVFYQIWDQPLMTINREELISKAIELCGGVNVFGHLPRLVPRLSIEAVLAANPQVIVTAGEAGKDTWLNDWQQYPGLAAVSAGNLFLEPPDLLARPTLRFAEGARHLCQTLEQARAHL
ncbi:MAG: cobalamin-binding protein [Pseudomonadota bacterium]|nr:cobalamin-binding protein [Pseudomonadota bacterium]